MSRSWVFGLLPLAVAACTLALAGDASSRPHSAAGWAMIDLGVVGRDTVGQATAINAAGAVVGFSTAGGDDSHGFLWQRGRMSRLRLLHATQVLPRGINDHGQIVGKQGDGQHPTHAFLWQNGKMTDLGSLAGPGTESEADAINDKGQIVGETATDPPSYPYTYPTHAFLWQKGKMIDLGSLGGPKLMSGATAINDKGQIVGMTQTKTGEPHAFLWQNGKMIDLGSLGGPKLMSGASAINNSGQIVGFSDLRGGRRHAVLWQHGKMTDLGKLAGPSLNSEATAINDHGQIVGFVRTGDRSHAISWQNGRATRMNPAEPPQRESVANATNDAGLSVGYRANPVRAVLWRPRAR